MLSSEFAGRVSRAARRFRIMPIGAILGVLVVALLGSLVRAEVDPVPQRPMSEAAWRDGLNQWMETNLLKPGAVPFSFVYDGKSSKEFLAGWDFTATKKPLDETRTQHILTYADKKTGLEVRCEATLFKDHPAVDLVLKFRNSEGRETPIIADQRRHVGPRSRDRHRLDRPMAC